MRKFLSEPLLHFGLIGVALFVLYQGVSRNADANLQIVVTEDTVAMLAEQFAAVWVRQPTATEIRNLVDSYIRDEILYRQGVAMGLDQNDRIIQRRVLQKLEVLSEETSALNPPTDAELDTYLQNNATRYAMQPVIDYRQVLFDPSRHGASLQAKIDAAMARLDAGDDPATLGDSTMLPTGAAAVPLDRLARDFGQEFADELMTLPVGSWEAPVRSGFGVHIVRVGNRTEARPVTLAEVRSAVERDWENDRRTKAGEAYYQGLLENYEVRIESALYDGAAGQETQQ